MAMKTGSRASKKALEARAIVRKVRDAGFLLELDRFGKPVVHPLNRLTSEQREILKSNREEIQRELIREKEQRSFLTPWDEPSWMELVDWWMTWIPPEEGYFLEGAVSVDVGVDVVGDGCAIVREIGKVLVQNPAESHAISVEMIRENRCVGCVELAMWFWMKRHWEKFSRASAGQRGPARGNPN